MEDSQDLTVFIDKISDLIATKVAVKLKNTKDSSVYNDDDCLNPPQAAKILGVSVTTLKNWRDSGIKLPYNYNVETNRVTYKYADLIKFLNAGKRLLPDR